MNNDFELENMRQQMQTLKNKTTLHVATTSSWDCAS